MTCMYCLFCILSVSYTHLQIVGVSFTHFVCVCFFNSIDRFVGMRIIYNHFIYTNCFNIKFIVLCILRNHNLKLVNQESERKQLVSNNISAFIKYYFRNLIWELTLSYYVVSANMTLCDRSP